MKTIKRGDLSVTLTESVSVRPKCKKTGYVLKKFKVCVQGRSVTPLGNSVAVYRFKTCHAPTDDVLKHDLEILRQHNPNYPRKALKIIKLLWRYKGE